MSDSLSKSQNKIWYALITLFIIPLSGVSIDIYVPSLPAVSHYFNVDKSLSQLSITAYMFAMGIMQLFAGSISDSFGRKKPFLIAMTVFILATLCIPFAYDINQLLFLRAIQGILVAVIMVSIRAVIPDLFEERELTIMTTYMVMAWSIGPIVAPAIGGYLQHFFGWQANFYFLAGYSFLGFILVLFYLPETSIHRHPFHLGLILKRYKKILSHKEFLSGIAIDGLLYSLILLFAVIGPFLIQTRLNYSAVQFGHTALLVGLAWFIGAMTSRLLVNIELEIKAKIVFLCMLFIAMIMIALALFLSMNIYSIVIPVLLTVWLGGILFPNYAARAIFLFPETTGSANALFGAFVFMISGTGSALGSFLKSSDQLPLAIAYFSIVILCLGISYFLRIQRVAGELDLTVSTNSDRSIIR